MSNVDLNTLLSAKIYYYFHEIGYLPKNSYAFNKLKHNITIKEFPKNITKEEWENASTNLAIYLYICIQEGLKEASNEIKNCIRNAIEIAATSLSNSDACYAISQFYHNITLNFEDCINKDLTYNNLKEDFQKNNPDKYLTKLRKSLHYITSIINQDIKDGYEINPNLLWIGQHHIANNKKDTEQRNEFLYKINYNAAKIYNIEKDILYTGNPEAELFYINRYLNPRDMDMYNKLIISASRVNYLMENPEFNIGSPNAQWILFNMLRENIDLSKYGIINSKKLQNILLESSIRLNQIQYFEEFENYTGNTKALQFYYNKIRKSDCSKKYKKIEKAISKFIKQSNENIK